MLFVMTMLIRLDSMKKVKEFVDIASHYAGKIKVSSGKYTVNGKSIMGLFSLELRDDLSLEIEPGKELSDLIQELEPYVVA